MRVQRNGQILITVGRVDDLTIVISSMYMHYILDFTLIGPAYNLTFGPAPLQEINVSRNYIL